MTIQEQSSWNIEAFSTSLNVKMDVLICHRKINNNEDMKIISGKISKILKLFLKLRLNLYIFINQNLDEIVTIEQLIFLHPLMCQLWMKLGESIYSMLCAEDHKSEQYRRDYLACYLFVRKLTDHFFAYRGAIVQRQKEKQKSWVGIFNYLENFKIYESLLVYLSFRFY